MAELINRPILLGDSTLKSYYQLEGNSTDFKANANGTDTAITYGQAKFGQGATFNGTTSKIVMGTGSVGISGATARTVSCWVKDGSGTGGKTLWGWTPSPTPATLTQFILLSGINAARDLYFWSNGADVFTPANTLISGTWVHVCLVYTGATIDQSSILIYVNGVNVTSGTSIGTPGAANTTDQNGQLGQNVLNTTTRVFDGTMDDVAIFARALSFTEVQQLYIARAQSFAGTRPHPFQPGRTR